MTINTPLTVPDFIVLGAYVALVLGAGLFMDRLVKQGDDFLASAGV